MADYTDDYEGFRDRCAECGLPDVTKEEWEAHAPMPKKAKHWGLMTALRRIKNARKGVGVPKKEETIIGYPLGGREFVPADGDINKSWKQYIPVLTDNGLVEVDTEGSYKGELGVKTEIHYTEEQVPRKDGTDFFINRTIQEIIIGKESIRKDKLMALAIAVDDLTQDMLKTPVIVKGVMSESFWPERIWEDRKVVDDWPVWLNENPCFQFQLKGENANILKVRLSPRKVSKLLIDVPDFEEIAKKGDLDEIAQSFAYTPVIVVGTISRFDPATGADGRSFVQMMATAIYAAEDLSAPEKTVQTSIVDQEVGEGQELDEKLAVEKKSAAPPKPKPAPAKKPIREVPPLIPNGKEEPKNTAPPTSVKERSAMIMKAVEDTAEALGGYDDLTAPKVLELNKELLSWGPSEATVAIAIKKAMEENK